MPATYEPIATNTLASATSAVSFTSITSAYTDLILVMNLKCSPSGANYPVLELNSDTGNNYSETFITANGTTASSTRYSNTVGYLINSATAISTNFVFNNVVHFMNYANTTTNKSVITRANSDGAVEAGILLWRNTAAINAINIKASANNWAIGSTFTLYGVKSA
jgi:hypothetical protein